MAVKRLATEAVLGEAPEDLSFTLGDLDRGVKFLAPTTGGCTDERRSSEEADEMLAGLDADLACGAEAMRETDEATIVEFADPLHVVIAAK